MTSKPTFGALSAGRTNNFDAIRFFLAVLVVFSHSFLFTTVPGVEPLEWLTGKTTFFGQQAVNGFFIISGFLITASWVRSQGLWSYVWKRILRIYPGFIVVSLICLFLIGPVGAASAQDYWQHLDWPRSVLNLLLLNKLETPPVFANLPEPNQLNGAIWTIKIEFECYILVALLGLAGLLRRRGLIRALFFGALALYIALVTPALLDRLPLLQKLARVEPQVHFLTDFLAGMLFYLYRDRIPVARSWLIVSAAVLLGAAVAQILSFAVPIFGAYILFYLATEPKIKLNNFAKYGDFSYGIYLYGWPIQLLVAYYLGTNYHPYLFFAICMPLVLLAAVGSWHLVEKRFLRLKRPSVAVAPPSAVETPRVVG